MARLSICRIALFFVLAFLAGCAAKMLKPEQISANDLNESNGVLIGSFSRNLVGSHNYSQRFYFKNVNANKIYDIHSQQEFNIINGGRTSDEFHDFDDFGSTFALKLPAGHYIFFNFIVAAEVSHGFETVVSKNDYAIPFDVHPDSVSYVGEIKLQSDFEKSGRGQTILAGVTWKISDQRARDIALLATSMPELPLDNVVSVIPTKEEIFTPLVSIP